MDSYRARNVTHHYEGVQKVFGTLDLFVSLLETEIKYPILQGGILPFWTPSFFLSNFAISKILPIIAMFKSILEGGDRPPSIRVADFLCLSLNT